MTLIVSAARTCGKPARYGPPCGLDPGHVKRGERHSNGVFSWALRGKEAKAAEPAENLKPCPAEDARGFACSKVDGHDGEHHNVRGWEPEDPEADAAALDAEEDRRASRWYCEEPFTGTDSREYKCEGRVDHSGSHYAWSVGARVTINARSDKEPSKEPDLYSTDACTKCGREMGEHDGKKCPKPVPKDRLAHVFSLITAAGASGAKATDIASIHRGALRDLERAGRITYRNERWFPQEPESATHCGYCESPLDDEGVCAACLSGRTPHQIKKDRRAALDGATATTDQEKTMETIDTDSAPRSNGAKKQPPKKGQRIEMIARDRIAPDPNQPRKTFDEAKLNELAASITVHGIEQPIVVRPDFGDDGDDGGDYIIVFGERRWRAGGIAGLNEIPCIVDADAGDDPAELLERQLVENAQRDDINPLEEGEALNALHAKHGYAIESLVEKTGKSRSHVYSRIALTKLAAGVKKAIGDGRLPHAHGGLIGTIPDQKAQEQCCKEVLGELAPQALRALEDIGVSHESVTDDANRRVMYGDGKPQVLSFRATAALIRRRYQTRLQLATFDPNDATLTAAGACGPCQHNSANQPELPGIAASVKPESHCGNLPCFEKKTQAQFKRAADAAKAQGKKVFEGKKAEAMFSHNGELKTETGFVAPDQRLPWNLIGSYDDKFTYKKMLGKHLAEVPTALVQNDRGAPIEVLDLEKAHEILKEHKLLPKKASSSSSSGKPTAAEKRAKEKAKEEKSAAKLREESVPFLVGQAVEAAATLPATKAAGLWRMFALFLRHNLDYGAGELYRRMYGDEEPGDHIGDRIEKLKTEPELRALAVELLMIQAGDDLGSGLLEMEDEPMDLATKVLGLDMKKAEKLALIAREQKKVNDALEKQAEAAKATKKRGGRK